MRNRIWSLCVATTLSVAVACSSKTLEKTTDNNPDLEADPKTEVVQIIRKVNDHWQASHEPRQNAFWHRAAYHIGNVAASKLLQDTNYLNYTLAWANHNEWKGAKSDNKAEWKYSYGEQDAYVLFGDWQACFQVYVDLYKLQPDTQRVARAREVMEYEMSTSPNDYWWWADGLFMGMPVMTRLYTITGNKQYLDKLYSYFAYSRDLMYDTTAHLFYRDAKYIYPKHQTSKGLKDFWARGNGWVLAALARVLDDLPADDAHRAEYETIFKDMAAALLASQQEAGYWTRSMLDPYQAPGPETSGTAFFTYGLLWGINHQLLDEATYKPVIDKSWEYLTTQALQADGTLGFVQPIGEKAIPGQIIDVNSTADFGVGAFLLAACEMYEYLK